MHPTQPADSGVPGPEAPQGSVAVDPGGADPADRNLDPIRDDTADSGDGDSGDDAVARDWAWVEQWRESDEPPAWAPGVTLAVFTGLIVGLAVLVLSTGLSSMPWLAVSANVLVAAGLAPALWLSRHLPVLRWISAGAAAGVLIGWIGALIS